MFLGLMALIDPPREAVPGAVHKCKTAGIKVTSFVFQIDDFFCIYIYILSSLLEMMFVDVRTMMFVEKRKRWRNRVTDPPSPPVPPPSVIEHASIKSFLGETTMYHVVNVSSFSPTFALLPSTLSFFLAGHHGYR